LDEERVWCRIVFRERDDGSFEIVVKGKDCDKIFKD